MELTKRQAEVLRIMRDEEEELVYERGVGYVGNSPVAARTVFALLRAMAISLDSFCTPGEGMERYTINETGRQLLEEHMRTIVDNVIKAMNGLQFSEEEARILTTAVRARTHSASITKAQLLHIYVEVAQGRNHHGDFLKSFAQAMARADMSNFALLMPTAIMLAEQYHLTDYLDNFQE